MAFLPVDDGMMILFGRLSSISCCAAAVLPSCCRGAVAGECVCRTETQLPVPDNNNNRSIGSTCTAAPVVVVVAVENRNLMVIDAVYRLQFMKKGKNNSERTQKMQDAVVYGGMDPL